MRWNFIFLCPVAKSVLFAVGLASAAEPPRAFHFELGAVPAVEGHIKVPASAIYSQETGFGFDLGTRPSQLDWGVDSCRNVHISNSSVNSPNDDAIRNVGTSLTANPTLVSSVTDTGYQNIANGYGGMTPGAEVGNLIRIIQGTGRNQPPSTITANTPTQLTFQPPLLMGITSVWIVEGPTWAYQSDSSAAGNASPTTPITISVPTENFILQPMLIAGFTVDVNGNESPDDGSAPVREDWIYGSLGTVTVSQSMTQLASHCTVQFDTSHVTGATSQLNAGIAAGATAMVLNSNYTEPNGTYLTIDSESFLVTAGTGTPNLTVVPGQLGTTQALHGANATVSIPGCLVYTLQRPGQVPNQNFYGHKNSPDINYVKVISPSGACWLLTDMSPARGTLYLKAPAQ